MCLRLRLPVILGHCLSPGYWFCVVRLRVGGERLYPLFLLSCLNTWSSIAFFGRIYAILYSLHDLLPRKVMFPQAFEGE
jgi:hypothetical protein